MAAAKKLAAGYVVVGAVAVLKLVGKGEKYLYKGTFVDPEVFKPESILHGVGVGLLAEVKPPAKPAAKAASKPADQQEEKPGNEPEVKTEGQEAAPAVEEKASAEPPAKPAAK